MKLLEKTHKGKIDFIYIDPPYNTKNKDFIYNDTRVAETDEYRHSKWLSFMGKRLSIARTLLSDDGIILISIDDNEQAQLKLLCDDIFGDTFCGTFIQLKGNTQNDVDKIQKNHEYILCYTKIKQEPLLFYENTVLEKVFEENCVQENPTNEITIFKKYYIESTKNGATGNSNKLIDRPTLGYTVYYIETDKNLSTKKLNILIENANTINSKYGNFNYYILENNKFIHAIAVEDYDRENIKDNSTEQEVYQDIKELIELGYKKIRPPKRKGNKLGRWTWGTETFKEYWNNNEIVIKNNKNIIKRNFIEEDKILEKDGKKYFFKNSTLPLQSIVEIGNTIGTKTLSGDSGILPGCNFHHPKSVELIKYLIKYLLSHYKNENCTVLDFFAGSGTTGQAVIELNKEDGNARKFILCTNNENNICTEITYPRLKTKITGVRPNNSIYSEEKFPCNLKYLQLKLLPNDTEDLEDELLEASIPLIELENFISLDNPNIKIIFNEEELTDLINNLSNDITRVYIAEDVILSNEDKVKLNKNNIDVKLIPRYYYKK